jgi:ABC-2 type transport system permease protein
MTTARAHPDGPALPRQTRAVASRALRQLRHDRRYLALQTVVPLVVVALLWVFFDAAANPVFDVAAFIPPVAAYIVHFLTYVLSAIVLVRERTAGTLERMFVAGYRRSSLIAGFLLAYLALATVQSLLVLVELALLFELDYDLATWASLYPIIWLLALNSIALGIFVSNFARNEGQVLPFIPLVLMVSVFFSGMVVAVERMPDWINWLRWLTPMYYATEAIHGLTAGDQWLNWLLALGGYGVALLALAIATLRD